MSNTTKNNTEVSIIANTTERTVLTITATVSGSSIIAQGYKAIQRHFGISEQQARANYHVSY